MTAIDPLLVAGAGLLLLSSRSKASAVEPRKYSTGLLIPTGKRKVRIERRKKMRAPLQPPLKPKEAAKRVRTVEAAAKRAKLVEAVEKLSGKRAATQLRGYLLLTGNYGLPDASPRIAALQRLIGVPATGRIDEATRAACARLGVELPGGLETKKVPKTTRTITRGVTRTPSPRTADTAWLRVSRSCTNPPSTMG